MQHRLTLVAVILTIKLLSTYAENSEGIPTECPQVDPINTTIHLAHEFDCSKFYACSNGRKILMMCPFMDGNGNRLHFNPKLQVCDWPNHARCNVSTSTTALVTESTNLSTDNSTESIETTVSVSTELTEADNSSQITETTTESYWSSSEQSTVASSSEENITSSRTSTDSTPQNTDRSSESTPITTEESTVSSTTVAIAQTTVPSQSTAHITNKPPVPSSTVTEAETSVTPQSTTHISEPTPESTTRPSESTPVTTSQPLVPSSTITEAETSVTPPPTTAGSSNTSSGVTDQPSVSSSTVTVAATSVPSQSTTHIPELTSESTASPSELTPVTTSKPSVAVSTVTEAETSVISQSTEYVTDSSPQSTTGSSELTSVTTGIPTVPSSSITESTSYPTTNSPTSTLQTSSSPDKTTSQSTIPTTQSTESSTFLISSITHNSTNTPAIITMPQITTNQTEITTIITIPTQITTSQTETTTIQTTTNPTIITTDDFDSNETTASLPTPLPECTSNVSGILYPHESNCSVFYECNHGDLVLLNCPEGLYFNASRQICVWPHETDCQQLSSSNSSTTVSATLSTTATPSTNISILCPADNSKDGVMYPHECVCSKFYTCTDGQLVLNQCPTGLDFNSRLDICDWPENAKCQLSSSSSHVSSTTESLMTSIPVESAKLIVSNSTQSDNLVDQSLVSTSIPVETIKPIEPSSTQSNNLINQSSVSKSECPENGSGSQIPHETNCRLYYECKDGEKLLKECSSGLEFNPLLQVCDWPEYAGCSQPQSTQGTTTEKILTSTPVVESTTPIIQSSTQKNETSTPKIQSSTLEFETSTSIAETSTLPSEKCLKPCPENDPIDYTVLIENENCSKFCKCSHGIPYVLNCPPGLYFNSLQQTCDYPERANCIKN